MIQSLIIKEVVLPTTNIFNHAKNISIKLDNTVCGHDISPDQMLTLLLEANNLIRDDDKDRYCRNYTLRLDP